MTDLVVSIGYGNWVIDALLAFPLLVGLAILVLPSHHAKYVALIAALVEFLISAPLWWVFEKNPANPGIPTIARVR